RLAGALKDPAGQPLTIGGKTGTGDHRYERFGKGGELLESRVVNRTATFVFYLGERYFGTLTALVPGEQAGRFGFTSSLTTQILKTLLPQLQPHLYPEPPAPGNPDGTIRQADPPVTEVLPAQSGLPENPEPGLTEPNPAQPPAAPAGVPAPAPASAPPATALP
ncbi:MAG: hypothetical protein WAK57_06640, partial [Desulfobacterales bacterium]